MAFVSRVREGRVAGGVRVEDEVGWLGVWGVCYSGAGNLYMVGVYRDSRSFVGLGLSRRCFV